MAKLTLNFNEQAEIHIPTKSEIAEIECAARSADAIIKALSAYVRTEKMDPTDVCMGVCDALKLLMAPVVDYLFEYAWQGPAPESGKEKGHEKK